MQQLADKLKSKQLKVTPQRLAIFKTLYHTVEHPSAETIYQTLQPTHPTMSLATVYKTLDTLKKSGLIQELNVGEDSFRYDARPNSHPHIICVSCNCVLDLDTDVLNDTMEKVQANTDFELISQQMFFYGHCPKCQNAK
jgi:Fur family peroxide stress response transcriptional regulator